MKNKKVLAIVMAVMTAASALVGCGSTGATAPADTAATTEKKDDATAEAAQTTDGEPVTITFMHDWPEYEAEFTQMISDFEAANPDIKVETQVITWDVLTQTLTTAFAAGEAPDVACCWANQMGSFNSVGATYDLTPYLEENNNEWRDSLLAPAVQSGTVNDQVFCIPFRTTCTVLAYNKTMMEENGWEVPTTLEEFETLLGEAAKTGVTPLLTPGNPHGFQIASLVETFALHYMYDAGYLKNNDYLTGHYTDVAKEYAEAGARLRDWVDKGYLDADSLAMTREDATGQFYLQKGLFAFVNNNELTDLEKNSAEAGFEIGVMAFPAPEGTPTLLHNFGVDGFMVYSGTKYPEQSARFLKYITSKDVQQKFGNETLSVMANKDCTYDNANQSEFAEIFSSAESYRKNYDYSAGDIGSDTGDLEAEFLSDPSETPEEFGQKIEDAYVKLLEENGLNSFNPVRDLQIPMIAAIRKAVYMPLDLHTENPKSTGGFIRHYEVPKIIKVASPVYLKTGGSVAQSHNWDTSEKEAIARIKQVKLVKRMIDQYYSDAISSPKGSNDLSIPE